MTDTNQASEDLDIKVNTLMHFYAQAHTTKKQMSYKKELVDLIRTEKLKLLAEVRERVVGRNQPLPKRGDVDPDIYVEVIHRVEGSNALRAEQREQLTKLEAEL